MNYRRAFLLPAFLLLAGPVLAQHPHNPSGGGAGHSGQFHPGQMPQHQMMTPEMHYQHMMQQFWYEQMLLDEMFRTSGSVRGPVPARRGGGQGQFSTSRHHLPEDQSSTSSRADHHSRGDTQANRSRRKQSKPAGESKASQAEKPPKERHNHHDSAVRQTPARAATGPNKTPTATDKMAIGLLRTVYSRLEKADADYRGHRLRAMEHISAAVRHLGAVSPGVPGLTISAANLPQAQSDRVLHDAIHTLSRTELMLDTSAQAPARHHGARLSVAEAIRQLHTALEIR